MYSRTPQGPAVGTVGVPLCHGGASLPTTTPGYRSPRNATHGAPTTYQAQAHHTQAHAQASAQATARSAWLQCVAFGGGAGTADHPPHEDGPVRPLVQRRAPRKLDHHCERLHSTHRCWMRWAIYCDARPCNTQHPTDNVQHATCTKRCASGTASACARASVCVCCVFGGAGWA